MPMKIPLTQHLVSVMLFSLLSVGRVPMTTDSHLKRILSTNICTHTVVALDDGPR